MSISKVRFKVKLYDNPVIAKDNPEVRGNQFGFETGTVVKVKSKYYMFVNEMYGHPYSIATRIACWMSDNRRDWKRSSTLFTSTKDMTGRDDQASLFEPNIIFDDEKQQWNLFYVAYRANKEYPNFDGRIYRAVSQNIEGPYKNIGVILEPGKFSQSWEGHQGVDSFYPYKVEKGWFALYGSAAGLFGHPGKEYWKIGLASAPALCGPWKRMEDTNPISVFDCAENPIVTHLKNGVFVAVFNDIQKIESDGATISTAISNDGILWKTGQKDIINSRPGYWDELIRTPFGLVPEDDNCFTVFYTARRESSTNTYLTLDTFEEIGISEWRIE